MAKKVAVIGVGHSRFGVRSDVTIQELAFEAVKDAHARIESGPLAQLFHYCGGVHDLSVLSYRF